MNHKMKSFRRIAIYYGLLSLIVLWSTSADGQKIWPDTTNQCNELGMLFYMPDLDGCEYVIYMDNGDVLEPVWGEQDLRKLPDSARVSLSYMPLPDTASICMVGTPAYIFCLTLEDDTIPGNCISSFEYEVFLCGDHPELSSCLANTYQFYGIANNNDVEWEWNVNGESFSSDQNPRYSFPEPGLYEVCLTTITADGCVANYCETIIIDTLQECQAKFSYYSLDWVADFDSMTTDLSYPSPIRYTYFFLDESYGDVISREWKVDGTVVGDSSDIIYTFPGPGMYEVCLSIITSDDCWSTSCEYIYIEADTTGECYASFEYYLLEIDCWMEDSLDCLPYYQSYTYQFDDWSTPNATYWYWDFGDGETSLEKNPIHTFPGPGAYEVCLTISSELDNCNASTCMTVYIDETGKCKAYFEHCEYQIPPNDSLGIDSTRHLVGFKNLSTPDFSYTYWNFGDGHYSTDKNPVHMYQHDGVYHVCLEISTDGYCYDTYCTEVRIGNVSCSGEFSYEIMVPNCGGFNVAYWFTPESESEYTRYYWNFGDGEISYEKDPVHIFDTYGAYEVCLEVRSEDGCYTKDCETIYINQDTLDNTFRKNCSVLPVKELESGSALSVINAYPVPAKEKINLVIQSDQLQEATITLTNILGQSIDLEQTYNLSQGENQLELQVDHLRPGNYIYQVSTSQGIVHGRISIAD